MGIATEEQSKRMADAIARDADRPLVERLRDPKNHYPAALRLEAAKRIAELESIVRTQSAMLDQISEAAGYQTGETYSGHGIIARLRKQGQET